MAYYEELMGAVGTAVDAAGVLIIVLGAILATGRFLLHRQKEGVRSYPLYRQALGRAILLGLEFLVAGDIIRTVVVAPTLENVLILGLIVLIRTFLSVALQLGSGRPLALAARRRNWGCHNIKGITVMNGILRR